MQIWHHKRILNILIENVSQEGKITMSQDELKTIFTGEGHELEKDSELQRALKAKGNNLLFALTKMNNSEHQI